VYVRYSSMRDFSFTCRELMLAVCLLTQALWLQLFGHVKARPTFKDHHRAYGVSLVHFIETTEGHMYLYISYTTQQVPMPNVISPAI